MSGSLPPNEGTPVWPATDAPNVPASGSPDVTTEADGVGDGSAKSRAEDGSHTAESIATGLPDGQAAESQAPPRLSSLSGAPDARVRGALHLWRNRLLDLTKRNRALNFKPNKVSTIAIVDEQPIEVLRHLWIEERGMRFKPTLSSASQGSAAHETIDSFRADSGEGELLTVTIIEGAHEVNLTAKAIGSFAVEDDSGIVSPELDFAPYDPETLEERHRDNVLQAQATPESLDKSLRRIDEQARLALDEQGVNVLYLGLGMLHYTESSDSSDVLRAPLIMMPVSLARRSARSGFSLQMTDEEPMVNPALSEYLRRSHGIVLPDLPPIDAEDAVSRLRDWYTQISQLAADKVKSGFEGWAVKTDIFLSLFSFQKLVMFKDLEANSSAFASHRLVRDLVLRATPDRSSAPVIGLPPAIRSMDLDVDFAPERTAQVVDADSSQLRAIVAVSKGYDLVIEGPPGTGKSQTITNLIAQTLSDGKSVLFVAEKMAALDVVHRRLVHAGLGEFCLEMHASKSNKKAIMQGFRAALDASLQSPQAPQRTQRLPSVRHTLSEYAVAVHKPHGRLGLSPFRAIGELDSLLLVPRLPLSKPTDDITPEALANIVTTLQDLASVQPAVGMPTQHAWRDSTKTFYTPGSIDVIRATLPRLLISLEELVTRAAVVRETLALGEISGPPDIARALDVSRLCGRSPGAPLEVLQSDAWDAPPPRALALVDECRSLQTLRTQIESKLRPEVFEYDHAADITHIEKKSSEVLSFLAFLDARFRAIKKRWLLYRSSGYSPSLVEQAADMKLVVRYLAARAALDARQQEGAALFGSHWAGERSDVAALTEYLAWVVEFRRLCVQHGLSKGTMTVAARPKPDVRATDHLEEQFATVQLEFAELEKLVGWQDGYFLSMTFVEAKARLEHAARDISTLQRWAAFERTRQEAARTSAADHVAIAMRNSGADTDVPFGSLPDVFRRAVLEKFLEEVIESRPPLREFSTLTHEERIKEFQRLDEWILEENRATIVAKLRNSTQERLQTDSARMGLPFLQREMAKQRNIAPIRRVLQNAEATIRAIKPCFLMSPLTVAQYLDGRLPTFDLIVFDEASQLPTEDAIGAVCRGHQLVVVGDPKQLPPTSFFARSGIDDGGVAVDGTPLVEGTESVLEEYMGMGVPVTRLRWHYRSAHESLIEFSNVSFYDSDLYTFPSVETGRDHMGLSFEHVADGVYEGKGLNAAEARRVADAVVRHAKERPQESLGVGTFNVRQQLAILDELELRRRQDPTIEPFFARGHGENFFVKNLENVQGDERDVMFISVTYARSPDGRLRYNFGPLNTENGWRRLNVLTTRARKRMRVFSSIHGEDINTAATTARGAELLRDFLIYAEHGRLDSAVAQAAAAAESPFEAEVALELSRRGVKVIPQVGMSGYRIDIGVVDDEVAGRFVCGIECDGVAYHSAESARDRDRLRQQVLEARGWIIHRVWSTDWFKDRQGQIDRLMDLISRSRAETKERLKSEAEAETRARDLALQERAEASAREVERQAQPLAAAQGAAAVGPYRRPVAEPYRFAVAEVVHQGVDIATVPSGQLVAAVVHVVETEAPVHVEDAVKRVASIYGANRVGARIALRVHEAIRAAVDGSLVVRRDEFLWTPLVLTATPAIPVRNRSGMRIPGERISPEEIQSATRLVLQAAGAMKRDELWSEVRQVLGVSKSSIALGFENCLTGALRVGWLGEGSIGIALRM